MAKKNTTDKTSIQSTTLPHYAPTRITGEATPSSLWDILGTRSVAITDKGEYWFSPLPAFFPTQTTAGDHPADAIAALVDQFGASEILGKILAQLLIDYRAAARAAHGKRFDPSNWTPNLAPLKRPSDTDKLLGNITALAAKLGLTPEDILAQLATAGK